MEKEGEQRGRSGPEDQEDTRRETVMCWCLWLGGKTCTGATYVSLRWQGGSGEEKFRCSVEAAVGQEAGSPKTSQNPSGAKGCP